MRKTLLCLALAVLGLVGCGGASIVGKWTVTGVEAPPGSTTTMDFAADDSCKLIMIADLSQMGLTGQGKVTVTVSGSYKLEGEKLITTFRSIDFKTDGVAEEVKRMMEAAFEAQKPTMLSQMQTGSSGSIKWDGRDKFTVSEGKTLATFTRVR